LENSQITIFKNIKDTSTPFYRTIDIILERIEEGKSKSLISQIRKEKDKTKRNLLKQGLPAICFSGKFNKRSDDALIEYSGYICLDFDGYKTKNELEKAKNDLISDKYVYAVFTSPSGYGLKAIIKIPKDPDNHIGYFKALEKHFDSEYFDTTSKNISRVCYESYDPMVLINENSLIWEEIFVEEYKEVNKFTSKPTIPITNENKIVEILMKWWNKKYGLIKGHRNHNVYILAAAFNDYGVNKTLAEYIMSDFSTKDFTHAEISQTINSAYAQTQNFSTKYYEDDAQVLEIKQKLKKGTPKKEIRSQLIESNIEDEAINSIIEDFEEEQLHKVFWTKSDKGTINIVHILFREFLKMNGYYKFSPQGSKNFVFVKVTNNLIDHTSEDEIKDFILNHLDSIEDKSIYNYFADKTRFFREDFLSLLTSVNVYFMEDNKDTAYLYYNNCAVKITNKGKEIIDYLDLGGFVWKDHVIDRDFNPCKDTECDYKVFISNVCGGDELRIKSMCSTIGYLLHAYKNLSYCPAVILNDEMISDSPMGGTGKGVFVYALGSMKKLVVIDGKAFAFEKSFAYQLVSADTQLLCFDDVKKHFEFERLFSVVTEGITLEKKNKDAIKIPFSKSPKIIITTNYAIKGKGASFERRKWELEFRQHYSKDYTPLMEFGRLFFGDWDNDEWCKFDNYMINNVMSYLSSGLIKSEFVNLKIRKLSAETCHEFIEWCGLINGNPGTDTIQMNTKLLKQDLYVDFIQDNPDFAPKAKMTVSRIKFYQWLNAYGVYKTSHPPLEGRDTSGRWIMYEDENKKETNKLDEEFYF